MSTQFPVSRKNTVVVKVGMLGDAQCGKTALFQKYFGVKYDDDYIPTLGINFSEKTFQLKNVDVTVSIWDLGGQKEFATLVPVVCDDAKVIIFVFDLTQKKSLFSVKRWYKEARKHNKVFIPMLIGTRYHLYHELEKHHQIDITKQARKFSRKMNAPLIYCSSEQNINVKNVFKVIVSKVFGLAIPDSIKKAQNSKQEALIETEPNILQGTKAADLVNGYIRNCQQLFNNSNSVYGFIPVDIIPIIFLYFHVYRKGNLSDDDNDADGTDKKKKVKKRKHKRKNKKKHKKKKNHGR